LVFVGYDVIIQFAFPLGSPEDLVLSSGSSASQTVITSPVVVVREPQVFAVTFARVTLWLKPSERFFEFTTQRVMTKPMLCMGRIDQIVMCVMTLGAMTLGVIMTVADVRPRALFNARVPIPKSTHVSAEGCA
jgi:hypothetical protein